MEFDDILGEIQQVMDKYGVELIIKSEISFKKLDATDSQTEKSSKSSRRKP